jgi:competence transcription factor ComK
MTEQEIRDEYQQNCIRQEQQEQANNRITIDHFKQYVSKLGISITDDCIRYITPIGIVVTYPDILSFLLPELHEDKEGLYSWTALNSVLEKRQTDGSLFHKQYMVMAHLYFRRGLYSNNNYAPSFINRFWNQKKENNDSFIALDKDRVRINVSDIMYVEMDTWYGSKFLKNINEIKDGLVKIRPPIGFVPHFYEFFFHSNYSLDIYWSSYENVKEFQLEEFKDQAITIEHKGKIYHPARYIHSEFDIRTKTVRHFAGAIHLYNEDEYMRRKDSDISYNKKNDTMIKPKSVKLFKFNQA